MLARLRYSVQHAGDKAEALAILLGADPPEVALLDAGLAAEGGIGVAAEVRRHSPAKRTWIILLSGNADTWIATAAVDAGVDDLLLYGRGEPDDSGAGYGIDETDFRVRLNVAARMQELNQQMKTQMQAASLYAWRDQLTGLWTRESMLTLLFPETDRVQRIGTPLAFLLLDVDHFARVNAEHGYETGDRVLKDLAGRLRRFMRSYDLIGRLGEDEFLVALPGCNSGQALTLSARIRTILLRPPFSAGRDMISLNVSVGMAQSHGRSPLVVLREAERALADAKREGRNCEREFLTPQQKQAEEETQPTA
jgi:diguanylate cyclase (GGDEF)-like protein